MDARDATDGDRDVLASFCCASSGEDYDREVEDAIRRGLDWRTEDPSRRLLIFEQDGEPVCVAAFGFLSAHVATDPTVWIYFIGVAAHRQGEGIGGRAFQELAESLRGETPIRIGWFVERRNDRSKRMCAKLDFDEWEIDPLARAYRIYRAWI